MTDPRSVGLVIAFVALSGCGGAGSPSPGPIVFSADVPEQLMVVNPDGTGARRLTRGSQPSWSPDGTKVAFARSPETCDLDACSAIWVVGADGSGERRLTDDSGRRESPAWSPDGESIAFGEWNYGSDRSESDRSEIDIFVMSAGGDEPKRLTDFPGAEEDPEWSPDGERIAFSADRDGQADIYVMNSDGSEPTRLTDTRENEFFPAWSSDGDRIAFERRGARIVIGIVNEDGSDARELRAPNTDWGQPEWSPDGTQLAFTTDSQEAIWLMDADGRNVRKVWSEPFSDPAELDWTAARD